MKVLVFLIGSLLTISTQAAGLQVEARKIFDGTPLHCRAPEDLKNKGFFLNQVQVTDLKNGYLRLSFPRPFVKCTSQGWAQATEEEFFKFTATNPGKEIYQFEYIKPELVFVNDRTQAYQMISLQDPRGANVAIDVRSSDLLDSVQAQELSVRGKTTLKLDVFLRLQLTVKYPQGGEENWGYRTSGIFRVSVPLTK